MLKRETKPSIPAPEDVQKIMIKAKNLTSKAQVDARQIAQQAYENAKKLKELPIIERELARAVASAEKSLEYLRSAQSFAVSDAEIKKRTEEMDMALANLEELKNKYQEVRRLVDAMAANPDILSHVQADALYEYEPIRIRKELQHEIHEAEKIIQPLVAKIIRGLEEYASHRAKTQDELPIKREKRKEAEKIVEGIFQEAANLVKKRKSGEKKNTFYETDLQSLRLYEILHKYGSLEAFLEHVGSIDLGFFDERKKVVSFLKSKKEILINADTPLAQGLATEKALRSVDEINQLKPVYRRIITITEEFDEHLRQVARKEGATINNNDEIKLKDGRSVGFIQKIEEPTKTMLDDTLDREMGVEYIDRKKGERVEGYQNRVIAARSSQKHALIYEGLEILKK